MTTRSAPDIKHGDRVTVLAGKARNPRTHAVLTRDVTIEVTYVGWSNPAAGTVEIEGVALTRKGAYASSGGTLVARSAIVAADAFTTPVRVGDTAQAATGETATVTAIEERDNGINVAALRFPSGETRTGVNLAHLEHLARPATVAAAESRPQADGASA